MKKIAVFIMLMSLQAAYLNAFSFFSSESEAAPATAGAEVAPAPVVSAEGIGIKAVGQTPVVTEAAAIEVSEPMSFMDDQPEIEQPESIFEEETATYETHEKDADNDDVDDAKDE